ncbi:HSF-type DNA-binding-domain-containing protein [Hyaloraphidium curvatum]|nr:HSF-type DNA-binding-domain-containing protein [Hyaloraphidium curvatum]
MDDDGSFNFYITPPTLQRAASLPAAAGFYAAPQRRASRDTPPDVAAGTVLAGGGPDFALLEPGDPLWAPPDVTYITNDLSSILGAHASDAAMDGLQGDYATQMSFADRPPAAGGRVLMNTFVHKLYSMVSDPTYQHYISWSAAGSSFVVCNVLEFSKEVLPKHYKHNNFSSFVRQLNMYGFAKVNKSSRGSKTQAENQVWEFSHPKFHRDHPNLLDDIRRKSIDAVSAAGSSADISGSLQLQMLQLQCQDLASQLQSLQNVLGNTVKELVSVKQRQDIQAAMMKELMGLLIRMKGDQERGLPRSDHALDRGGEAGHGSIAASHLALQQHEIDELLAQHQRRPLSPSRSHTAPATTAAVGLVDPSLTLSVAMNTPLPPSPVAGSPLQQMLLREELRGFGAGD